MATNSSKYEVKFLLDDHHTYICYIINMSVNKSSTIGLNCGSEKLIVKH